MGHKERTHSLYMKNFTARGNLLPKLLTCSAFIALVSLSSLKTLSTDLENTLKSLYGNGLLIIMSWLKS